MLGTFSIIVAGLLLVVYPSVAKKCWPSCCVTIFLTRQTKVKLTFSPVWLTMRARNVVFLKEHVLMYILIITFYFILSLFSCKKNRRSTSPVKRNKDFSSHPSNDIFWKSHTSNELIYIESKD